VEPDKVKVTLERGAGVSTLGLDIELPLGASAKLDAKLAGKIAQVAGKAAAAKKAA
jgi:cell division topological specificity factor